MVDDLQSLEPWLDLSREDAAPSRTFFLPAGTSRVQLIPMWNVNYEHYALAETYAVSLISLLSTYSTAANFDGRNDGIEEMGKPIIDDELWLLIYGVPSPRQGRLAMNLRSVNLNLLVIFDALMRERHVTRAALRIPMTQPAMSNALARLRLLFEDDLFIRAGNTMEPTPRAVELGESVSRILRQTERLMSSDVSFDPATAQREFTARMSDLVSCLVLPQILATLSGSAPGVTLDVLHMSPERTVRALENDQLDFALSMRLQHASNIRSEKLFMDEMVCVMRADHELTQGELTLERFLDADHLRVKMSPTDVGSVDNVLAEQDYASKVVAKVPHWLLVPPILRESHLVAVISSKLAALFASEPIAVRPLPFPSEPFSWDIYWHRRNDNSVAHKWMRGLIASACAAL
ncbi:LysR family transcriptional regulator [Trinickia mobilis]|uniref:LysR family transcriptional regulator n=1 Tax=Trinickia mobilis TaxID=2816356 RepID=UPI001F5CFB13|nr:LysR family transcriptional regulator [Trinickia mobilis]